MEAPRDEMADKVEEDKPTAGGRLDDLDEVEQAAREASRVLDRGGADQLGQVAWTRATRQPGVPGGRLGGVAGPGRPGQGRR
jgi:hypothetical protein